MVLVATWRFTILQMFSKGLRSGEFSGKEVYKCFCSGEIFCNFCSVARSTILHENTTLWVAKPVSHLRKNAAFKNFHILLFVHHAFNNRNSSWIMIVLFLDRQILLCIPMLSPTFVDLLFISFSFYSLECSITRFIYIYRAFKIFW